MIKRFGKSLFKGFKYATLGLGAAALSGVSDAVPGFILDVLLKAGTPEMIASVVAAYGTPAFAAVVAIALEQVRKHRDAIFGPQV